MRLFLGLLLALALHAADLYVSPRGDDAAPGTRVRPLRSFDAARHAARRLHAQGPVTVHFLAGTYSLPETIVFTPEDSGSAKAPITYQADPGQSVILSGGTRLQLRWRPYRGPILQAQVPAGLITDQLFADNRPQTLARYPNRDPQARYLEGWAADAASPARAARWANPAGGFLHALHRHLWGDFHYRIDGKQPDGQLILTGGWQNNRRLGIHDQYRFVENIFEELDAPGEWYLDTKTSTLYFYPPPGIDPTKAAFEAVRLKHLIEFRGDASHPVHHITLRGFTFRHSARTFMDNREPLLRSDWTIYRGGALFLTGVEDVAIEDSTFDHPGGNAIFFSNYARRAAVRDCHIVGAGANGIAFVGDPAAVRSPLFFGSEKETQHFRDIDRTAGPRSANYPADSLVEDCLIHSTGRVEKQTAPVHISMAQSITVRHCSIYDVPRAGINIGDGTWGGHLIEFNDVFNTVLETGDHGAFNSWGRDRFWGLQGIDLNKLAGTPEAGLPLLDAVKTTVLRNNRFRCDHGWDIDLDDGSSNYEITNNLCLRGGLKLREGFQRRVENNVTAGNTFHPHVWFESSGDVFRRNIVFAPYRPIRVPQPWGADVDHNLFHQSGAAQRPARVLQSQSGRDQHSILADALFLDPAHGDFRVQPGSPAATLGFVNFPMDQFGVHTPALRALAQSAPISSATDPPAETLHFGRDLTPWTWLGATVRNVAGWGEVSAAGLPSEIGVLFLAVPASSEAARFGLQSQDILLSLNGQAVTSLSDLKRNSGPPVRATVRRGQSDTTLPSKP